MLGKDITDLPRLATPKKVGGREYRVNGVSKDHFFFTVGTSIGVTNNRLGILNN